MSWPSDDFELEIQVEMNHLRALAQAVEGLIAANDGTSGERTDIAWAKVKRAYGDWQTADKADI